MELAPAASAGDGAAQYYMPHHAVVREVQGVPKIRVVFNTSHRTSSGTSLNDILLPGPKTQTDIAAILTRWRRHLVVFAADIVKMFHQIRVAAEDCDLQRVVWRESPSSPVKDIRLLTVTYGTACAFYLAFRTLQQLAEDEARPFPSASHVLRHDTYVDDTPTGADNLASARDLKKSLTDLLRSGGFELGKWISDHPALLLDTDRGEASPPSARQFEPNEWVRTLGVVWTPSDDSFRVRLNLDPTNATPTKRLILSELARTFDPLGWIAPVLVYVKILLQDTWISGATWDEPLQCETLSPWLQHRSTLPRLKDLTIPRWLGPTVHPRRYQLHGFSDALERAYAAAAYVAPVKSMSLPRLELCGAALLARLIAYVKGTLEGDLVEESFAWSDFTVALAWIRAHPSRWVTFVKNRVAEIQTLLPNTKWQHVKSAENTADLATRGITPEHLIQADLWWQGPSWLKKPQHEWSLSAPASVPITDLDSQVEPVAHATCVTPDNDILAHFSSLRRLIRVTARCVRIRNGIPADSHVALEDLQPLSAHEVTAARTRWIVLTRGTAFSAEIAALQKTQPLPARSALARFNPFLDDQSVPRLSERLQHDLLSYQERHPAIPPGSSIFTLLLVQYAHDATLHGGAQLTMSHLLRYCWILGRLHKVRSVVRRCVECTGFRAPTPQQQMGQLRTARINRPARPFEKAGLDYAGPFLLRTSSGRGRTTLKGYIALFVCLATRASHLDVVGSYSTASFLAALRRFTAHRGICSAIHSDNETNFRRADQELRRMFLAASASSREIASILATDGTQWHFISPSAPHFGGLWEAGVWATKYHLRQVIGETILYYEEFATVAAQIKACLNSRPICPLSADPSDLVALTPGNFVIGGAPTTPPEPNTLYLPLQRLGRWQLTTRMLENFWRRWSSEYRFHLQQRNKWQNKTENIEIGDLVLLKDDQPPPAKWPRAWVIETHPGPDGLVRVVTVKTATSSFRRPIVKLVALPVKESSPRGET